MVSDSRKEGEEVPKGIVSPSFSFYGIKGTKKVPAMASKFCRISCNCEGEASRRGRSNYLGDLQVDVPNTARHFCGRCNTLWEHKVDDEGNVFRRKVTGRIKYYDEVVIVK